VPGKVAGAGLTAFAAGLLGLYLRTPGMRPTQQGTAIAKDVWLLGIGLGLLAQRCPQASGAVGQPGTGR